MIPSMRLNTAAVTTSHPPHSSSDVHIGPRRHVAHNPPASSTTAAGSSHAIPPAISAPNSRPHTPPVPPPPTRPTSSPVRRPNPL